MWTRRTLPLSVLALLVSCATAQPAQRSDAFPLPPDEPPAQPSPTTAAGPARHGDASSVNGPDGLVALCESLRDESGASFSGNPVQQARASEARAQRRQDALARRYVVSVPSSGFGFRSYDLGDHRLVLDTERSLVLGDGAELIVPAATSPRPDSCWRPTWRIAWRPSERMARSPCV